MGDSYSADAPALFGGMGFAALYAFLRDQLGLLPGVLFLNAEAIPGVVLGLYNSPMMLAMGFTVGVVPAVVWFIGAVLGHFGIVWALPALGIVDLATAGDIRVSIGLGLMLGCGAGTIVASFMTAHRNAKLRAEQGGVSEDDSSHRLSIPRGIIAFVTAAAALLMTIALGLNPAASIIVTVGAWFCPYLSAWLTGTTGINPMEIFGMLVLLLVRFLFVGTSTKVLFLVAAVIAVACGIGGDLMNDFKAGDQLGTNPRDQYIGEVVGGIVGAVVAALLLMGMHRVYGSDAFGPNGQFVATQATNVAAMAGGIAHVPAFIVGIIAGCVLAILGLVAEQPGIHRIGLVQDHRTGNLAAAALVGKRIVIVGVQLIRLESFVAGHGHTNREHRIVAGKQLGIIRIELGECSAGLAHPVVKLSGQRDGAVDGAHVLRTARYRKAILELAARPDEVLIDGFDMVERSHGSTYMIPMRPRIRTAAIRPKIILVMETPFLDTRYQQPSTSSRPSRLGKMPSTTFWRMTGSASTEAANCRASLGLA